MSTPNSPFEPAKGLQLQLAAGSQGDRLFPEQAALFEITLSNDGAEPVEAFDLFGNESTPQLSLFDDSGNLLQSLSRSDRTRRRSGHVELNPPPPNKRVLKPGQQLQSTPNLWKYVEPLLPGRYRLRVAHGSASKANSNSVPFEIVAADVAQVSHGYNVSGGAALFAWVATARDGQTGSKLLVRLSSRGNHELVAVGALSFGTASPADRVAVSGLPLGPRPNTDGWVALISDGAVRLTHQNLAVPDWSSTPIKLEATDLRPVPRFPDRGRALFLATGTSPAAKPVLAGVLVEKDKPGVPWTIPLDQAPLRADCIFGAQGPIRLLLLSQRGEETILSRLDLNENGGVESPQRVVGHSPLRLLASAVDQTQPEKPAFLVLLADRNRQDLLALARVPLGGEMDLPGPEAVRGWPTMKMRVGDSTKEVPRNITEIFLEVASNGTPWIALADDRGAFHGGPLRGPGLSLLRDGGEGRRCFAPRVVVSTGSTELCCFTETGNLFHAGGH